MLLIKLFCIGLVRGPRSAVLNRGRRPRSNTAAQEPVTGPIRNNLIKEILLTHLSLVSFLWDIGKQHSPRCDAAERGVPSGAILFA